MRPWARITLAWVAAFAICLGFAAWLSSTDGWDATRYTWTTLVLPAFVSLTVGGVAVAYSNLTLRRKR